MTSPTDKDTTPKPPKPPQEEPVCAVCGKPIERDDLVCPHCGTRLVSG